eukprot:GHVH01011590.1.p1 GENE.GHVH01011590.1~~GHVH01011590.1.p1  ORF type:complete len:386 (+),score=81.78 GHVH01011590.1:686-1843(+)
MLTESAIDGSTPTRGHSLVSMNRLYDAAKDVEDSSGSSMIHSNETTVFTVVEQRTFAQLEQDLKTEQELTKHLVTQMKVLSESLSELKKSEAALSEYRSLSKKSDSLGLGKISMPSLPCTGGEGGDGSRPTYEELEEDLERALNCVKEEAHARAKLRKTFESQTSVIRKTFESRLEVEKERIVHHLEGTIEKYRQMASHGVELVKIERRKLQELKKQSKEELKEALSTQNAELEKKYQIELQELRTEFDNEKKKMLQRSYEVEKNSTKMEDELMKERHTFQAEISRDAEKRISGYKEMLKQMNKNMEKERTLATSTIQNTIAKITSEAQILEDELVNKFTKVLWMKGVVMKVSEVKEALATCDDDPLEESIPDKESTRAYGPTFS